MQPTYIYILLITTDVSFDFDQVIHIYDIHTYIVASLQICIYLLSTINYVQIESEANFKCTNYAKLDIDDIVCLIGII